MASGIGECRYRFGVFEADGRTGELRKQGRAIKLRGRPFDILVILLARGGDVVSRDELRQLLWPADTFVDFDHGLNSAMNRLREAIGDSAENPRFVETLPKRGYRFIAPIELLQRPVVTSEPVAGPAHETPPAAVSPPVPGQQIVVSAPSRIVLLLATGALAIAIVIALLYLRIGPAPAHGSKMTLAVLPFDNLSAQTDQEFFADGFTEEMIAELGKLDPQHLGVIARTTTRLYKNTRKDIGQIRQELGVDYVLEGSIRRADNRMRITAQLIQTSDMTHLWAESYDRNVADVLTIQSEVAMKIAQSLTLALRRPTAVTASTSSSAYDLYLRGRFFREQDTEESTRRAIEFFQRAIAADPRSARSYAGIADGYRLLGAPGWEIEAPSTLLEKAQANAERALEIDPQLAEAHAVLAMIRLSYRWDRAGAEQDIREAIRLNPSFAQAHQYYSTVLTTMGRFDAAIDEAKRSLDLDPLSAPASTTLGIRYYYAGRCAEAAVQFQKTLETNPGFGVAHWGLAQCARERRDRTTELHELEQAVQLSGNSAYMRAHLAYGIALAGDRDRAVALQRELESEARARYQSPYHLALVSMGLADRDGALGALEGALTDRSGWMVFLPVEPEFAPLRQDPRFQRLLARVQPMSH
jgi:TolB-like protein/DNA-binding winged helix-turn-helix (wHTH) protein/Flp pilus assembly protein TadD